MTETAKAYTDAETEEHYAEIDRATALEVPIQHRHPYSEAPRQGKRSDAGYDLTSIQEYELDAGERQDFGTGIAVAIPEGYVGYIKPRSGLALRHGIDVLGGVIDSGYRGEIRVILLNTGTETFLVQAGDRIAQLVIQPVAHVEFIEVPFLETSVRGISGFGSTGVSK